MYGRMSYGRAAYGQFVETASPSTPSTSAGWADELGAVLLSFRIVASYVLICIGGLIQ